MRHDAVRSPAVVAHPSARVLPRWAPALLAASTSVTSVAAHRLGGGMLPSGVQWALPLIAFVLAWLVARPLRLTPRSLAAVLVLGQALGHVALAVGVRHAASGPMRDVTAHGHAVHVMAGNAPTSMLLAHVVGTVTAWGVAAAALAACRRADARWSALLGRIAVPRQLVRRLRVCVRSVCACAPEAIWLAVAPRRGPPVAEANAAA